MAATLADGIAACLVIEDGNRPPEAELYIHAAVPRP
jgi:hypothetical protein